MAAMTRPLFRIALSSSDADDQVAPGERRFPAPEPAPPWGAEMQPNLGTSGGTRLISNPVTRHTNSQWLTAMSFGGEGSTAILAVHQPDMASPSCCALALVRLLRLRLGFMLAYALFRPIARARSGFGGRPCGELVGEFVSRVAAVAFLTFSKRTSCARPT
jgi:hypothetical protein